MTRDLGVYLVTDRDLAGDRSLVDIVEAACAGGASIVQLREKSLATGAFVALARALIDRAGSHGVPVVVNDRVDVALAAGAAGVHVGQEDLDPITARRLLGPEALIGLSVGTVAEAVAANDAPIDYLGVGAVFATATKPDAGAPIGLAGLAAIARLSRHPVVGIGGIGVDQAAEVIRAGAVGVAVVSAIIASTNPRAATRAIRERVEGARR